MLSPTCFEPLGLILRETVVYAVWCILHVWVSAVWRIVECVRDTLPVHQTAHTDACKTHNTA